MNELYTIGEDSQGRQVIVPLRDSRVVKALNGDTWENDHREQINYYDLNELRVQSNAERLAYNLEEIKENGYPSSDERIILFNDSNVIRDGGHRAGVLYKLYGGEYRVPIRRLLFRNSRFSDICDIEAIEHIDVSDVPELIIRGNEVEIDLHSLLKDNNTVMAEISRKTEESDDNTEG